MPFSSGEGKVWCEQILHYINSQAPIQDVLDVGIGAGTYSDLFRSKYGKTWYGIEIYEPYIETYNLTSKYNRIFLSDARQFTDHPEHSFSVAFLGDVLEHMTRTEAMNLYLKLLQCCDYVILSIPIIDYPQEAWGGNEFERHVTQWTHQEVVDFFPNIKTWYIGDIVGCYVASKNYPVPFKAGKKAKVAVYAITKNEEKFVDKLMGNVLSADYIVISDTGSTDSTWEKLCAWREKYPKKVILQQTVVRPFRFDVARNASMTIIPDDADVAICMDFDEILVPWDWKKFFDDYWFPWTKRLNYNFIWSWNTDGSPRTTYRADKIHSRHGYLWVGPVHETLHYYDNEPESIPNTDFFHIEHYPDNTKPRSHYFPLLELAVKENPHNDRNSFYLGREYFFNKMWDKAVVELKRHQSLPSAVWDPEIAASMRFCAQSFAELGRNSEAEIMFFQAIAKCPWFREPWLDLAKYYLARNRFEETWMLCNRALQITDPGGYIVDHSYYRELPYDLLSVAAHFLNKPEQACEYALKALEYEPTDARLIKNYQDMQANLPQK